MLDKLYDIARRLGSGEYVSEEEREELIQALTYRRTIGEQTDE